MPICRYLQRMQILAESVISPIVSVKNQASQKRRYCKLVADFYSLKIVVISYRHPSFDLFPILSTQLQIRKISAYDFVD